LSQRHTTFVVDIRRILSAAALAACLLALSSCSLIFVKRPAVEAVSSADQMVVYNMRDKQGQPSPVRRLRIVDQITNQPILELEAIAGEPRLAGLELKMGDNPVMPAGVSDGAYGVILPHGQRSFQLEKDRDYQLQLWGSSSDRSMSTAIFHFAAPMKADPARSVNEPAPAAPAADADAPASDDDANLPPANTAPKDSKSKHRLE